MDYVGILDTDKRPVTLNMLDVAASYVNDSPYSKEQFITLENLYGMKYLFGYMGQKNLEEQVLAQLDNDVIKPEAL